MGLVSFALIAGAVSYICYFLYSKVSKRPSFLFELNSIFRRNIFMRSWQYSKDRQLCRLLATYINFTLPPRSFLNKLKGFLTFFATASTEYVEYGWEDFPLCFYTELRNARLFSGAIKCSISRSTTVFWVRGSERGCLLVSRTNGAQGENCLLLLSTMISWRISLT